MKRVLLILMMVIGCFLLASCEKETILTVNQTSLSFNNSGGSQTVNIIANKVWSSSSNQSWCKVSPSSGDGSDNNNFTLSVSCDANTTYDERTCTITVVCEELTKTITVTQAEGKGLIVSQTEYNITNEAQTISVEIQANVQYTVSIDDACKSWIKQESTKGLSSNTIKFAISKNESYDGREGKITVKQTDGSLSGTVVVKQSQQNALFVTTSEYNLSNEKHTLTVEVKANIEFDVKPNVDWIKYVETKGLKTSQIVLDVAANEDYDSREGTVTVKQKNGDLEGVITIRQEQNYGILVSPSEFSLTNEAQTIEVEVKYNVEFDVVIPDACKDWISILNTKGLSSRYYTLAIAKNETYDNREGSITFKQKNGSLSGTIAIKQKQTDGIFIEKDIEITYEEQTISVEVKANVDYEVVSESEWIQFVETKGLSTSHILLAVTKNDSDAAREGKVTVKQKNGGLVCNIIVKQMNDFNIVFADRFAKAVCVKKYDVNGDGEVSCSEVGKVTDLGRRFFGDYESGLQSFEELRYFTSLTYISEEAFAGCYKLEKVVLPPKIREIRRLAFNGCAIKNISLPSTLERIEYFGLACRLESITLPESLQFLGSFALSHSTFKHLSIPSCAEIGEGAIANCINLESVEHEKYATPDKRCLIVNGVLYGFAEGGITSYRIPAEAKSLGKEILLGSKIDTLIFNENITEYPAHTFGATQIKNVVLPSTTLVISNMAFLNYGMDADTGRYWGEYNIFIKATEPPIMSGGLSLVSGCTFRIYVPKGCLENYLSDESWKKHQDILVEYDFDNSNF